MDCACARLFEYFTISEVRYIEGQAATQILIDASAHSEEISTLQTGRQHNYTHTQNMKTHQKKKSKREKHRTKPHTSI